MSSPIILIIRIQILTVMLFVIQTTTSYAQSEFGVCAGYGLNSSLDWPTREMVIDYRAQGLLLQKRITYGYLMDFGVYFRWSERNKIVLSNGMLTVLQGMNIRSDIYEWQFSELGTVFSNFTIAYYRKLKNRDAGFLGQFALCRDVGAIQEEEKIQFGLGHLVYSYKVFQPAIAGGYYFYLLNKRYSALRLDFILNYGLTIFQSTRYRYFGNSSTPQMTHYVPIRNKYVGFKLNYEFSFKNRKKIEWKE